MKYLVLITSKPQSGRTGMLAQIVSHYPGPVMSTLTEPDVFELTSGIRSRFGPVHVFNPLGIGGVPSTIRWNPVLGCDDPAVAIRRADGFANAVSLCGTEDVSFWSSKASGYLGGLFHAAALTSGDMRQVARWVMGSAAPAEDILAQAGSAQWAEELAELRGDARQTTQSIRMVLSRALAFMTDPALMRSVLPSDETDDFDIEAFLAQSGTLYLIAESGSKDSPVGPLFAAMADEIHHAAALSGHPVVDLNFGAARTALPRHVQSPKNGTAS